MRTDPVNTVRIFRTTPPSARGGQNTAYPLLTTPRTDPCEPDSGTRLPPWVIDGEALAGPGMEDKRFREPLVDQLLYSFPREAVPLAAPPEHAKPEMGDVVTEPCKCATIRRHRMIVEVACNDLLQPLSLFGNWLMHPLSQFLLNLLKLSLHAVPPGLPLDQEVTAPGFAADEGKPQEVEGLRFAKPTPFAVGRCEATELN